MAAELRAAGATWETIAEQLDRHPNHVSRWSRVYREEWEAMLQQAEERQSRCGDDQSRSTLKELLRSQNPKARSATAGKFAQQVREDQAARPPGPNAELLAKLAMIEEMSDEELDETLDKFIAEFRGNGIA